VATGPNVDVGDVNFELKSSLINMVQASPFCGKPNEDANAHLQNFLELCKTVCLYAMAKKIRYTPVMGMFAHWQKMITCKSPIDITSLVTYIVRYVDVLENAQVTYLPTMDEYRTFIGLDHFFHAYMMRDGPGNSVFMCYPGYEKEFELPCPKLSLYSVKHLTLQMERKEPARHNTAGPMTRGRVRRDAQLAEGGTSWQAGVSRQPRASHQARASQEAGPSNAAPSPDTSAQPHPDTTYMSFEEAYGFYDQGGQPSYQPKGSTGYGHDQGFYHPSGMGTSHGPLVGPSASACFEYDNPLTWGLSDLNARMSTIELQQEELGHDLDHNTSLTQESWGDDFLHVLRLALWYVPPPATARPVAPSFVEAWGERSSVSR
jgi:hypothetical protein